MIIPPKIPHLYCSFSSGPQVRGEIKLRDLILKENITNEEIYFFIKHHGLLKRGYFNEPTILCSTDQKMKIPKLFLEIREIIDENMQNENFNEIRKLNLFLEEVFTFLRNDFAKNSLKENIGGEIKNAIQILILAKNYIDIFYEDCQFYVGKKKLTIDNLMLTLDTCEKHLQINKKHTLLPTDSAHLNFAHLSLGGFENLEPSMTQTEVRKKNIELLAIMGFSVASASTDLDSIPLMMVSFGLLALCGPGIGTQKYLGEMILNQVYESVVPDLEVNLSDEVKLKLLKHLPNYADLTYIGYKRGFVFGENKISNGILNSNLPIHFTFYDAEQFYSAQIKSKNFNIESFTEDFCKFSNNLNTDLSTEEQKKVMFNTLFNKGVKINREWGTYFDHLFKKFTLQEKIQFLHNMKSGVYGFESGKKNRNNIILDNFPIEINIKNLITKIKQSSWDDRMKGMSTFSRIIYEILVSSHSLEEKNLLFDILENELKGKDRGLFSNGVALRPKLYRTAMLGIFYCFVIIASVVLSYTTVPAFILIGSKILLSGCGAMTFGMIGYSSYFSLPSSYKVKTDVIKNIKNSFFSVNPSEDKNIFSELEPQDPITINFSKFQAMINKFKKLNINEISKDELEVKINKYLNILKSAIYYFNQSELSEIVFELNQSRMDCPIFIIVRSLLDIQKNCKDEKIKLMIKNEINIILNLIYQKRNLKESSLRESDKNFNEDTFRKFLANGFKNAISPKEKLIFSLRAQAYLEENKDYFCYKFCVEIFSRALFNSIQDNASLLHRLQERNFKSYAKRRVLIRYISDVLFSGLMGTAVTLIATSSVVTPIGIIGFAFASSVLVACNFAGRKYGESFIHTPSHRNFKTICDLVGVSSKDKNYKNQQTQNEKKAKEILTEIYKVQQGSKMLPLSEKHALIVKLCESFLTDSEKTRDDLTQKYLKERFLLIKDTSFEEIERVIFELANQSFDKESLLHSQIRTLRLIVKLDFVSNVDKSKLMTKLIYETCYDGELSVILKSKSLWTKNILSLFDYLAVDITLGFIIGSLGVLKLIPYVSDVVDFLDTTLPHFVGSPQSFATSQSVLNFICVYIWMKGVDRRFYSENNSRYKLLKNVFDKELLHCQQI